MRVVCHALEGREAAVLLAGDVIGQGVIYGNVVGVKLGEVLRVEELVFDPVPSVFTEVSNRDLRPGLVVLAVVRRRGVPRRWGRRSSPAVRLFRNLLSFPHEAEPA
jgi:hypothetical protein